MAQAAANVRVSARLQAKEEAKEAMQKTNSSSSSEGKRIGAADIQMVQNLIERCMQNYMPQKDVVQTLQSQAKIEPGFTTLVWQKLEEQNPEFFKAYYLRLKLKDQIVMFNYLVEQQMNMMQKLHNSWLQAMPQMMGRPQGMMGPQMGSYPGMMMTGYGMMPAGGTGAAGTQAGVNPLQPGMAPAAPLPLSPLDPSSLIGSRLDASGKLNGSSTATGRHRSSQPKTKGATMPDAGAAPQGSEGGVTMDALTAADADAMAHLGDFMQGTADDLIDGPHTDMPKNYSFSDFATWPDLVLPAVTLGMDSGAHDGEGADLVQQAQGDMAQPGNSGVVDVGQDVGVVGVDTLHSHVQEDEVMGGAMSGLGVEDGVHHSFDEGLDVANPFGLIPDIGPLNFDGDDGLDGHEL